MPLSKAKNKEFNKISVYKLSVFLLKQFFISIKEFQSVSETAYLPNFLLFCSMFSLRCNDSIIKKIYHQFFFFIVFNYTKLYLTLSPPLTIFWLFVLSLVYGRRRYYASSERVLNV